jgi:hypothetical protein
MRMIMGQSTVLHRTALAVVPMAAVEKLATKQHIASNTNVITKSSKETIGLKV